jgi:hypothetical protein
MRDPHVEALRYRLELTTKDVTFDNPPPVKWETDAFRTHLADGVLNVEMKKHFASLDAARAVVEDFFRAWEIDAALSYGRRYIRFIFENAQLIDRDPPPPGTPQVVQVSTVSMKVHAFLTGIAVTQQQYPEPPRRFRTSPDVETLWQRYEGYLEGREPLLAMANACLTLFEAGAGGRRIEAVRKYNISRRVLRKLGNLASKRGDEKTARKFRSGSTPSPLTPAEITWVEAVVKAIIRRVGEYNSTTSLPKITKNDLPPI